MNTSSRRAGLQRPLRPAVRHGQWLAVLVLALPAIAAAQQALPDPTRPPAAVLQAGASNAAPAGAPVLQSVLIIGERRSAVISGATVAQGERYGDARVVRITETEVVLRGADGVTTLRLYPQVEKRLRDGSPKSAPSRDSSKRSAAAETRWNA